MRQQSQQEEIEQTIPRVLTPPAEEVAVAAIESAEMDLTARKIEALGAANRRRKRRLAWMRVPAVGIAIALTVLIVLTGNGAVGTPNYPFVRVLLGFLCANYAAFIAMLPGALEDHNGAVRTLANTDDLRVVGVLAEALSGSEMANSIAGSVLIRLLPRLRPEDAALLTPSQRRGLRTALRHATNPLRFARYNPTLAISIVNALAQIGDAEDLPALERLARRQGKTAEQHDIGAAAERCVAHLCAKLTGVEGQESPFVEERHALRQAATQLTPEAVERLSSQLRQIARLRQRNLKVTAVGALSGIGLACTSLANSFTAHPTSPLTATGLWSSLGIMLLFGIRGIYAQRNLTQALIHTDDLRIVGPLVEAASSSEISGAIAAMALTPLLSRLQASDAGLLDATGRECLNKALLRHRGNAEFVLAALRALQQIGDGTAVPVVQKLADRADRSAAGQSVREAALECLPFLQQRAAQHEASQILLRASEAFVTPPDTLLRPVQDATMIVAEELLRPGTPRPESSVEEGEGRTDRSPFAFATAPALNASAP